MKPDMFLFNCSLSGVCALYLERMAKAVGKNDRLKTVGQDMWVDKTYSYFKGRKRPLNY